MFLLTYTSCLYDRGGMLNDEWSRSKVGHVESQILGETPMKLDKHPENILP
jgi:hypothetical protein